MGVCKLPGKTRQSRGRHHVRLWVYVGADQNLKLYSHRDRDRDCMINERESPLNDVNVLALIVVRLNLALRLLKTIPSNSERFMRAARPVLLALRP